MEQLNKKYDEVRQKRISLEMEYNKILKHEKECSQKIKIQTKVLKSSSASYEALERASARCMSLIDAYNLFERQNEEYIDKVNKYFTEQWTEFESKWVDWNGIDIISWLKYKTRDKNTSNIDWEAVKDKIQNRKINGALLQDFSKSSLNLIGIHDFKIADFLMTEVIVLRTKYSLSGAAEKGDDLNNEMLQKFICPLTNRIMKDPVMAFDANVYEKAAIEEYLKRHKMSPVTKAKACTLNLYSHRRLKKEIESYCSLNNIEDIERVVYMD